MQEGLVCREMYPEDQEEQGLAPLHSEHTPSPFTWGTYWGLSLSATWDQGGQILSQQGGFPSK